MFWSTGESGRKLLIYLYLLWNALWDPNVLVHFLCHQQRGYAQREEAFSERSVKGVIQRAGRWTWTSGTKGRSNKHNSGTWNLNNFNTPSYYIKIWLHDLWKSPWSSSKPCLHQIPQGPVCLHGSVIFPWRGPVARQTLGEHAKAEDARGLQWQVGHRDRVSTHCGLM